MPNSILQPILTTKLLEIVTVDRCVIFSRDKTSYLFSALDVSL